jgi:hypothetical protein
MTFRFGLPISAFLAVLGTGCATTAPPNDKTASTSGAIRAAEEVGATHSPDAALYLQLAKEEFGHARVLTDQKNKEVADRLLMRAQADAELSLALARDEKEKTDALAAIDKVKKLKDPTVQ